MIPRLLLLLLTYLLLLFSFSVLQFLVVVSVRKIKPTHVGFRAHVKTASRIVSYCHPAPRSIVGLGLLVGAVVVVVPVARRHGPAVPAPAAADGGQRLEPVERRRVKVEQLAGQRRAGPEVRQHEHLALLPGGRRRGRRRNVT